jgi:hypothetical protein
MSDIIPPPSDDSVNLEVLRPFRADYLELQNAEEKKVLLQMQKLLTGYKHRLRRLYNAIGLEGRIVMPLDDQLVVQVEWAFHDVMFDGQTILTRVAANPPELTPKALRALRNRSQARYSVFRLNNLVPELGVEFEDLIFGGKFAVLDLPTAEHKKPGDLMAARIYWTGEYWTHSSGRFFVRPELLPLIRKRVDEIAGQARYDDLPSKMRSQVTTEIMRTCAEDMANQDPMKVDWGVLEKFKKQTPFGSPPGKPRVGRNDRCPCGSVLKYKHCCGSN